MLKKNVGGVDRVLRVVVGIALIAAFFLLDTGFNWVFLLGVVPLATGLISSCPLYSIFGLNTCPMKDS